MIFIFNLYPLPVYQGITTWSPVYFLYNLYIFESKVQKSQHSLVIDRVLCVCTLTLHFLFTAGCQIAAARPYVRTELYTN